MFIRKKNNPNDYITIQVAAKSSGAYRVQNFGVAKINPEQEKKIQQASLWMKQKTCVKDFDFFEFVDSIQS